MKGLGRNVKFMTGFFLKLEIKCYLFLALMWVVFGKLNDGIGPFVNEQAPFYIFWISVALVLICAMSHSDMYFKTMVSQGSARKPAAFGMLLSQYAFVVIQVAILLAVAMLTDSNWSLAIKICPLGLIAVIFILQGAGIICATLSMSGHNAWAVILFLGTLVAFVLGCVLLGYKHDFVWSAEMVEPYNNLLFLATGVVLEIIGLAVYYKTMQKVDLKLA